MRNGGDLVVETLSALGATTVFGIPGQHALGFFDALTRSELQFISSRVENNSAFAADGYARATRQPGILFVSTGPGALTALAGVQEAYASGVPMLVLSSQIPEEGLGGRRKGMLHQLDYQKASARNVTKTQETIHKASSIPYALEDAWQTALTAPQGPVWVEIPQDVLLNETSVPAPGTIDTTVPQVLPHAGSVERAVELLASAKRPAIIAGGGVRRSNGAAQKNLQQLAELIDAPVVCTPGGNTAFPYEHPLSLGGWIEDRYVTEVLEDADVLLAVGTSLGEVSSNYFTMEPRGQLIQIDAHVRVLESNYPGLGIRADASIALAEFSSELQNRGELATSTWHGRTSVDLASDIQRKIDQRLAEQELTHEIGIMNSIRSAIPDTGHGMFGMHVLDQCILARAPVASVMDSQALLAVRSDKVSEYSRFLETVPPCIPLRNLPQPNNTRHRSPGSSSMTADTASYVNTCTIPSAKQPQPNLLAPILSHYPIPSVYQP